MIVVVTTILVMIMTTMLVVVGGDDRGCISDSEKLVRKPIVLKRPLG